MIMQIKQRNWMFSCLALNREVVFFFLVAVEKKISYKQGQDLIFFF